ncbi:hypothetical protein JMJ35_002411 [Cladonia borealis]|uniref:amidase n=1 Tax=Cladonia borealis TaxID=184061 RepID=A0AA39R514_9LECA|nr:hypothetical protein JMJ35_002411 [Cladonia borealis]
MATDWQRVGQQKRETINSLLPPQWKLAEPVPDADSLPNATKLPRSLLTEREIEITETHTAQQLAQKLADRTYTATEVTRAFCHRATIAHQLVNCLSEVLFDSALKRAGELDSYIATYRKPVGPLHGLPISLKDQFRIEGAETSVGYVGWLGKPETAETESEIVRMLIKSGAVVHAKTNVPTGLMAIETNNNIVGYTWNAFNRHLSSGGSSGGEASLIAMKGSLIGLGTDIGASIRLPASANGLYGLKPSSGRLPYKGVANTMEGQNIVESVVGPIAHRPSDLQLMMETLLSSKPWERDPCVLPLPWREIEQVEIGRRARTSGLCFGVMRWDGMVMPHPPILQAIDKIVTRLRENGHEVVEWMPPSHAEAFEILFQVFTADGGAEIHKTLALSNEPPVPQVAMSYGTEPGSLPTTSITEYWALQLRKRSFQERYASYWQSTASTTSSGRVVDAVIMPVAPSASVKPGQGRYFGYTGVANVLDYSAVTIPVGMVNKESDFSVEWRGHVPVSDMDREIWESFDPGDFHGAPVAIQLLGRRLEEEKLLAIAQEFERWLL